MSSKRLVLFLTVVALTAFVIYFSRSRLATNESIGDFKSVEGTMKLTDAQKEDLPKSDGQGIQVHRHEDENKLFQVALGNDALKEDLLIGELDKTASKEVAVPVYLCAFQIDKKTNLSLDTDKKCSNEGRLEKPEAIGYLSKEIRVGFRMLVRCRSQKSGLYLSLNPRCESAEDRVDILLGSIRSVL